MRPPHLDFTDYHPADLNRLQNAQAHLLEELHAAVQDATAAGDPADARHQVNRAEVLTDRLYRALRPLRQAITDADAAALARHAERTATTGLDDLLDAIPRHPH
ncbi:hypothetical protein [Streptomyces sp. Ac-502]|uniref:hypothetical protein n=1 Tax=Streptomyces sp. Ac-502 TaxID=3342801 RepID=UPI003862799E